MIETKTYYPWGQAKRYNDSTNYYKKLFSQRIQKISVDAGMTCPNRDGSKGSGGCIYCDNLTFNPFYCSPEKSITQQLEEGIVFFSKKYKTQKYLAYFQAFTNTYADFNILKKLYDEALAHPSVIGIVIGTRPDCITEEILDYLSFLAKKYYVVVEYGMESCYNKTLDFINRCHTFEDSVKAVEMTVNCNIIIGAHFIFGLPGETTEMILNEAKIISQLPINILKLHQLQIIKETAIEKIFNSNPDLIIHFSAESYIELIVDFIERVSPLIVLERFISESPREKIVFPDWKGIKNFEIVHRIEKRLSERNTWQGKYF